MKFTILKKNNGVSMEGKKKENAVTTRTEKVCTCGLNLLRVTLTELFVIFVMVSFPCHTSNSTTLNGTESQRVTKNVLLKEVS